MNVLILTPDAVGSTLLQRVLTIYMTLHQFDKPVINIHELTNGIKLYYSQDFNRTIIGRGGPEGRDWQTLPEILDILKAGDHYKTGRLAHYYITNRNDPQKDLFPFYEYLNENFYIIKTKRKNVLEYGLSWMLNNITKKLNVYDVQEKVKSFIDFYKDPITLNPIALEGILDRYKEYNDWANRHFNIGSVYCYEDNMPELEKYILNLPMFAAQPKKIKFEDVYGISFKNYNKCHRTLSDIGTLALENQSQLLKLTYSDKNITSRSLIEYLPDTDQAFIRTHEQAYEQTYDSIQEMQRLGILVTPVPIKKQTLEEKKFIVKNFDECLEVYNHWARKNLDIASVITAEDIQTQIDNERSVWSRKISTELIPK